MRHPGVSTIEQAALQVYQAHDAGLTDMQRLEKVINRRESWCLGGHGFIWAEVLGSTIPVTPEELHGVDTEYFEGFVVDVDSGWGTLWPDTSLAMYRYLPMHHSKTRQSIRYNPFQDQAEKYGHLQALFGEEDWMPMSDHGNYVSLDMEDADVVIRQGFLPGQKLLFETHFYASKDYFGDYDEEWGCELIYADPIEFDDAALIRIIEDHYWGDRTKVFTRAA